MIEGLNPIINADSEFLILGSFPGVQSLNKKEYYAHKHNSFWGIIFQKCNEEPECNYTEKCRLLLNNKIALWDIIHRCERDGSQDSNIKKPVFNNIPLLLEQYPKIKKILCNGKKAYHYVVKQFPDIKIEIQYLPSTSPANNGMRNKRDADWKNAF